MKAEKKHIGEPLSRVDGKLKVTGKATYAAEYNVPGLVYGVLATSTIAKGEITGLNTKEAEASPGVLAVITHLNAPKPPGYTVPEDDDKKRVEGQAFRVLHDGTIHYNGQPIALAIADTFERATYAASLITATYTAKTPHTNMKANLPKAVVPKKAESPEYNRGDTSAFGSAGAKVENRYETSLQVHNPMEPHAAITVWKDDALTVYNKTQSSPLAQKDLMQAWQLPKEKVHIISKFVGGAFGGASRVWPEEMAATIGAKQVGKPVKVVFTRDQLFNMVGYRPISIQTVGIGTSAEGKLTAIKHEAFGSSSSYETFTERMIDATKALYDCDNVNTTYKVVPLDVSTPAWTRGPGESSGVFALESAIDEMAYALNMDPLVFRKKNYASLDPDKKLPWSSKFLNECYEQGAETFGWHKRNPEPASMQDGDWLVGMGMCSGIYGARRSPTSAKAVLRRDGNLTIQSATADVGPGTATIMTQIAADESGIPLEKIIFELGDSDYPPAVGQFGSMTTTSVGSAVYDVCQALKEKMVGLAKAKNPVLENKTTPDFRFQNETISVQNPSVSISYTQLLEQHNLPSVEVKIDSQGNENAKQYSSYAYNATFVEVRVHSLTKQIKVHRVVSAIDAGKIVNTKTGRSQVYGGITWGIGQALSEESVIDDRYGRWMIKDLADYHVPVHADIPDIDVIFIDKPDEVITSFGAKGLGEIPIVGFAAAVANAIFHATGKRIRHLPITPDKLL